MTVIQTLWKKWFIVRQIRDLKGRSLAKYTSQKKQLLCLFPKQNKVWEWESVEWERLVLNSWTEVFWCHLSLPPFSKKWHFSIVVLNFWTFFLWHHFILWTCWFHCHTPYSCYFGLLCLQYLNTMKIINMAKNLHIKIKWYPFSNRFKQFWRNIF